MQQTSYSRTIIVKKFLIKFKDIVSYCKKNFEKIVVKFSSEKIFNCTFEKISQMTPGENSR